MACIDVSPWNLGAVAPAAVLATGCPAAVAVPGGTEGEGSTEASSDASADAASGASTTASATVTSTTSGASTDAEDTTAAPDTAVDPESTEGTGSSSTTTGGCETSDDCGYGEICNFAGECVDDGCEYFDGFGGCIDCSDHEDCDGTGYEVCIGALGYCSGVFYPSECFEGPTVALLALPTGFVGAIDITFVDADGDANQDVAAVVSDDVLLSIDGVDPTVDIDHGTGDARLIATGDFDGDTREDLLVATTGPSQVTSVTGDGAGGFTVGPSILLAADADDLAVGDFNNDGADDVAISSGGELTVWLRAGEAFEESVQLTDSAESVVASELDHAPGSDVAFTSDGIVSVWSGNGTGDATVLELGDGAPFTDAAPILGTARQSSISDLPILYSVVPVDGFSQAFAFDDLEGAGGGTELQGTFSAAEELRRTDAPDTELVLAAEDRVVLVEISTVGLDCTVEAYLDHSVSAIAVGDIDGDLVDDVVAVGPTGATRIVFEE